jgi:uncharacterized phage-associated protein
MPMGYSIRKAAQVVAFLVAEQGGAADMIKTVKLAYLSDRKFLDLYDRPILNDDLYCLDHGPIDSMTLNLIKGDSSAENKKLWSEYLTAVDPKTHSFGTSKRDIYFDELSEAEEAVLKETVQIYGHMKPFDLVEWIHANCKEWSNPKGTSKSLSYADVFKALGKKNPEKSVEYVDKARARFQATA